jgi:hypothetical protein
MGGWQRSPVPTDGRTRRAVQSLDGCCSDRSRVTAKTPRAPRVTTTSAGPRACHSRATSSSRRPGWSQRRSSSLTLTMSDSPTMCSGTIRCPEEFRPPVRARLVLAPGTDSASTRTPLADRCAEIISPKKSAPSWVTNQTVSPSRTSRGRRSPGCHPDERRTCGSPAARPGRPAPHRSRRTLRQLAGLSEALNGARSIRVSSVARAPRSYREASVVEYAAVNRSSSTRSPNNCRSSRNASGSTR